MNTDDERLARIRTRREPPPLRPATVTERHELSPRMLRVTFEGSALREMTAPEPAASVRLLVPAPGSSELVMPAWNGNEFLLPDGGRPALRTFTPLRFDPVAARLDLEIVRHRNGAVAGWAEQVGPGAEAAISGPGRGYAVDPGATRFVLLGDETALPAIGQLLEVFTPDVAVEVHAEVVSADAVFDLPDHPGLTLTWHVAEPGAAPGASLVEAAIGLAEVDETTRIWAAGEAAAMQAIRTRLFDDLGIDRSRATVRGYWKPRRSR